MSLGVDSFGLSGYHKKLKVSSLGITIVVKFLMYAKLIQNF